MNEKQKQAIRDRIKFIIDDLSFLGNKRSALRRLNELSDCLDDMEWMGAADRIIADAKNKERIIREWEMRNGRIRFEGPLIKMTPRPTAEERAVKAITYKTESGMTVYLNDIREQVVQAILEAEAAVREDCAKVAEKEGDASSAYTQRIADAIRKAGKK